MPSKNKSHSPLSRLFFLTIAILGCWFWTNSPSLINYSLHLVAFLVALYSLTHLFAKKKSHHSLIWDALLFTVILLLTLSVTGGLASPFFFLIYFLLFATALLFDALFTFTLVFLLAFFFIRDLNSLRDILQLLSLFFLTPLALYLGRQYLKLLAAEAKIKILAKEGRELEEQMEKTETDSLLWLSLNLKNGLLKIIHYSSELLGDVGRLGLTQKEKLQSVHQMAKELLSSSQKLMEKIDEETDQ